MARAAPSSADRLVSRLLRPFARIEPEEAITTAVLTATVFALLVDYDRAHVIPVLLLRHPSRTVVLRTLEVLASSGRRDFMGAARSLLERDDDEISAAAMLALAHQTDPEQLRGELEQPQPIAVRAAVLVAALARELDRDGSYAQEVERGCGPGADLATRLAYARALRLQADTRLVHSLALLARDAEPALELEVARAMLVTPNVEHIPELLHMLSSRDARSVAREALCAIGDEAQKALALALEDPALPSQLRTHLPRSISRFGSAAAADILLDRLDRETHGWVRFKIIRGLGQLRQHMRNAQRARRVLVHARANLSRAAHFMAWRIATDADRAADPRLSTQGGDLLVSFLREKELHAIDRAVRLVGLLHSADVIHNIRQALAGADGRFRADGVELLVHVAPNDLAQALALMLAQGSDAQRLSEVTVVCHMIPEFESIEISLIQRIHSLRSLWGNAKLPTTTLAAVAGPMAALRIPAGTVLAKEGEPIGRAYFVVEGEFISSRNGKVVDTFGPRSVIGVLPLLARVAPDARGFDYTATRDSVAHLLVVIHGTFSARTPAGTRFQFGAGDMLGTLDLIAGLPRWFDVEVQDDVVALSLDGDLLVDLWEDQSELGFDFLRVMATMLMSLRDRIAERDAATAAATIDAVA